MWQITACDAGSSYAWARVIPGRNAGERADFLTEVLVPAIALAGGSLGVCHGSGNHVPKGLRSSLARAKDGSCPNQAGARGGQRGSWSGCRARSSPSTGGWSSAAGTSRGPANSRRLLMGFYASITRSGPRVPDPAHPDGGVLGRGRSRIRQGGPTCQQYSETRHTGPTRRGPGGNAQAGLAGPPSPGRSAGPWGLRIMRALGESPARSVGRAYPSERPVAQRAEPGRPRAR